MANKALSKFFFFIFVISCIVCLSACGPEGPTPTEDGGQVATDGGVNDGGPATADGGTDGGLPTNDGGQDAGVDGGDPLAEYMWIQGTWVKTLYCTTVQEDGGITNCSNMTGQPVDVTVESWDNTNGATVRGFNPMRTIYIKKNNLTNEFEINIVYQPADGSGSCKGTAEQSTLKMKMLFKATSTSEERYYEWEKQ